jgi:hypothetical protein
MKLMTLALCTAVIVAAGCKKNDTSQPQKVPVEKTTVQPGRHMSEEQVMDVAFRQLQPTARGVGYQCEFNNGVWEISETQPKVWGVSSRTTNADGKIVITSTNATRLVLRIKDADGQVEQVKTP